MEALKTVKPPSAVAPTFESVWAMMQENAEAMKEFRESQKETDRIIKESQKETERLIEENSRSINALNKQMGGLHNSFGEMAEHLVAPGVVERFNNLGYHFDGIADRGFRILDENRNLKTEIDILLENGDYILAVEVKAKIGKNDIKHHVKRLEILRQHRNKKHKDPRKIRGAIAGAIFYPKIKEEALKNGFYVLEQAGDTMKMDIPKGFKPKEW